MRCAKAKRYMTDYADGTLRPRLTEQLRDHVSRCDGCLEEEQAARAVTEGLRGWRDMALPEDGLHRLETRLAFIPPRGEEVRRRRWDFSFLLPYAAGLATAAALMFMVWHPWQGSAKAPASTTPAVVAPAMVVHEKPADDVAAHVAPAKERVLQYTDPTGTFYEVPWNLQEQAILRRRMTKAMFESIRSRIQPASATFGVR